MSQSIPSIMLKEHNKIKIFLDRFEQELNENFHSSEKTFIEFKWSLEKHFFIEEKVIFTVLRTLNEEENEDMFNLLKEHKDMLFLIKNIEEHFFRNIKPDIRDLKKTLLSHAGFENEFFYPKLEMELNEKQKCLIIEQCKAVIDDY